MSKLSAEQRIEHEQGSWRDDLTLEMKELARLGVNVPKKAFDLVDSALLEDYQSMNNTEVVDHLIMLSIGERV
jgi:hypothetical protein